MRKKWFSLGCLTSILMIILFMVFIYKTLTKSMLKNNKVQEGSYLSLHLSGKIDEFQEYKDDLFIGSPADAFDIKEKIYKAKDDPKITGILLEPYSLITGYATLNEIMEALKDFKTSGKPIIAYLKYASDKEYYLATVADKIYLNPSASSGIILTGVGGNYLYYKDMFDKIGVDMQVVHAGKFKGYGENYTRNSMSEPIKMSLENLLDDVYSELIDQISNNRGIPRHELIKIYEEREDIFISKQRAIDLNLVDGLIYREKLLKDHNLSKKLLVSYTSYDAVMKSTSNDKIAILQAEGSISEVTKSFSRDVISAKVYVKTIDEIEKDPDIKAVVLRINSPGGSALESAIINDKIMKLRAAGKPVVVSMGNVAASGGYYIASNADYIFADPLTITGSIGVVMMFPNLEKMGNKLGLHSEKLTKGKYASFLNVWEPLSEKTRNELENQINGTYNEFKSVVAKGRKIPFAAVEDIAQGRVWSSRAAIANNLVDEIGGLTDAISKAAQLAEIKSNFSYVRYPKKKTFYDEFLDQKFSFKTTLSNINLDVPELDLEEIINQYNQIKAEPIQQRLLLNVE